MERLENVLRQTGNASDQAIANGINAFRRLRGRDIPITVFLGLEKLDQSLDATSLSTKKRNPLALYEQTAASIRDKILAGEYPTGSKIPTENERSLQKDQNLFLRNCGGLMRRQHQQV